MGIALCTADAINYDIASFSKLSKTDLNTKRRTLVCTECNGKGYYRKKSIDGKPACFKAYRDTYVNS